MTATIPTLCTRGDEKYLSGEHTPEQLAAAQATGYHNYFRVGLFDAIKMVQDHAPSGWSATYLRGDESLDGAVRVGQVRVHQGDSEYPLVIYPKTYGRWN